MIGSQRSELGFLIGAFVLCVLGLTYVYLTSPTRLTVAVATSDGPDAGLFEAFAAELRTQRKSLRLRIVPQPDVREAAQAMERGRVDLAVVRPDVALPANGLTVAIMREAAAIVLAPQAAKIADVADLAGKRLGVALGHEGDPAFFETILRHFELQPPAVTIVKLSRAGAAAALREKRVDAIALIADPGEGSTQAFVREIGQAAGGRLTVVPTEVAEALASTNLVITSTTIADGLWSGRPKLPDGEIKTVGASYRLMARQDVDRTAVALVAENLFQMRSRLAVKARSANLMQPPSTDASSTDRNLPNHPGAVDFFQREQERFIDKYGDWLYLVALFGSGLISAAAAFRQRWIRQRREQIDDVLDRLLAILAEARRAETIERLDEISSEIDELLATAVGYARRRTTGSHTTSAIVLALDGARAAVADRRRLVMSDEGGHHEAPSSSGGPEAVAASGI